MLVGCNPELKVAPQPSNLTLADNSPGSALPATESAVIINEKLTAIEKSAREYGDQTTLQLNQVQSDKTTLRQQIANLNFQFVESRTNFNNFLSQSSPYITNQINLLPGQLCSNIKGTWTGSSCLVPPETQIIYNEENAFNCQPGAFGCAVTPVEDSENPSTNLLDIDLYGSGVCQNATCGIREYPEGLLKSFTVPQYLGCRFIETQLRLAGQSLFEDESHMFIKFEMFQNEGPLKFAGYSGSDAPSGERFISRGIGGNILPALAPNEIAIYHRGSRDNINPIDNLFNRERNRFKQRTIFLTPTTGSNTRLSFRGTYSMFAVTQFIVSVICHR